jgi:Tol biopolymer transport system component/predicted Ser/Thr protein kinase
VALSAGTRLGPYEIVEPLGAGGMGEVYRARDTRLDRTVALKVLPSELSGNPKRRERLEREARAISRLSHPHICALHDIGREGETDFLVMEYLEGETLAGRLKKGRLPLDQTLRYATEIAGALDEAHRHGVVHRDLKPGNVMLTRSGAKLLDFGLAKLRDTGLRQNGDGDTESALPTLDDSLTDEGTILGTYSYMAPEQLEGRPTDARTDVFAFGAMLHEMVTGKRAFEGKNRASVIAAILEREPPLVSTLEPLSPAGLDHVVRTCLAKDPDDRWQSAHDLKAELRWIVEGGSRPGSLRTWRRPQWRTSASRLGVVTLLALGAALGWWLFASRTADRTPPVRITPFTADGGAKAQPRFSPDGEEVAYDWAGPADDNWDIYVKALGAGAKPLRLTDHPDNDWGPAWSPDGRRIAFVRWTDAAAAVYTVPSLGGQERKVIDLEAPPYYLFVGFVPTLSWSPDGEWLAFPEREAGSAPYRIVRLSLATLEKQVLTSPPPGSLGDLFSSVSPDGRHLAFVRSNDVWVQRLGGGPARRLTSGHYTYCPGLAWAPDGVEIFYCHAVTGVALGISRVRLAGGRPEPLAGVGPNACWPTIRGDRLVYGQEIPAPWSLWRTPGRKALPPDRAPEKLIASSQPDYNPDYSPDGRRIAFASERSGVANIWVCESDGTNPVQLTRFESYAGTPRWSPDGRKIVFDSPEKGNTDVWLIDAEGGIPRPLTHETSEDFRGSWSRDGQWIYFVSDRTGTLQTWKMPAEGGPATQVTRGGGNYARESGDGRHLYYTKGPHTGIWRVPVDGGEEIEVLPGPIPYFWDWALVRDGIYFAMEGGVSGRRHEYRLQFLDFGSGGVTELYRKEGAFSFGSLAVSPDERWILHGESPLGESELMLVENFR